MTLKQEAIQLLENQPEMIVTAMIDLMKALPKRKRQYKKILLRPGKGIISLSDEYINHFDDDNEEIAALFYGDGE